MKICIEHNQHTWHRWVTPLL